MDAVLESDLSTLAERTEAHHQAAFRFFSSYVALYGRYPIVGR